MKEYVVYVHKTLGGEDLQPDHLSRGRGHFLNDTIMDLEYTADKDEIHFVFLADCPHECPDTTIWKHDLKKRIRRGSIDFLDVERILVGGRPFMMMDYGLDTKSYRPTKSGKGTVHESRMFMAHIIKPCLPALHWYDR